MNKTEFYQLVAQNIKATAEIEGLTQPTKPEIKLTLDTAIAVMKQAIVDGDEIAITGLGVIKPSRVAAKQTKHIKTGEPITIPERNSVKFLPSKLFKTLLNGDV